MSNQTKYAIWYIGSDHEHSSFYFEGKRVLIRNTKEEIEKFIKDYICGWDDTLCNYYKVVEFKILD